MKSRIAQVERIIAGLGGMRRGVVRTDLAQRRGVEAHELRQLRDRGVLVSVGRGVDRLRDHPFDFWSQCQAALDLAGEGAVLGLRTAARLLGFYAYRNCETIEVLVSRSRDHETSIGRIVQTRKLPPAHVTVVDGLPVTNAARTFFDLCGHPDPQLRRRGGHPYHARKMARVYNDAVARRGLTFYLEVATHIVMAKRGRRGTVLVRELLLRFGPEHVPTHSEAESLFMELLDAYDIPHPKRQVAMSDDEGFIGVVDCLWEDRRHVVEVDSLWHDGPIDVEEDAIRDERLRSAGYTVARYRYGRMIRDAAGIARELGRVID